MLYSLVIQLNHFLKLIILFNFNRIIIFLISAKIFRFKTYFSSKLGLNSRHDFNNSLKTIYKQFIYSKND
jgi:hypothetical protein